MLTNYHTHTSLCDGENSPEEVVLSAIENGFSAIGFSGHGYTPYDLTYCLKDTDGYIREISRLKAKYGEKIQIYTGLEEDSFSLCDRSKFDYIIGSAHYILIDGKYYSVDSGANYLKKCLSFFDNDVCALADAYYKSFCDYILKRKPDIIGHFDLITKFDELDEALFLNNDDYLKLAKKYIVKAAESGSLFEINTGAMSRGYRKTPYPCQKLIYVLKKCGAGFVISSDSHSAKTLDFGFSEVKKLLLDAGVEYVYAIYDGEFKKDYIR